MCANRESVTVIVSTESVWGKGKDNNNKKKKQYAVPAIIRITSIILITLK